MQLNSLTKVEKMKYVLYIVVAVILYRLFFKQTIVIEHRHFYDEKPPKKSISERKKGDYTDYEELN